MRKVCIENNSCFRVGLFAGPFTFENGIMWEHEKLVSR